MEPFFESQNDQIETEQTLDAINEIYDLVKPKSNNNDINEETKQDYLNRYGSDNDSPDDDEELDNTVTKRAQVGSNLKTKLEKVVRKSNKMDKFEGNYKVNGVLINGVQVDENHFINPKKKEEVKNPTDEVENEQFDFTLKNKQKGIVARAPRISAVAQDLKIDDFDMIRFLGDGAYGKVNLVKCRYNNLKYALKILDKKRIAKYDKVENVMREKDIMYELDHPNIARLEYTFQDQASLFFVMEYAPNGDLSGLIKKEKRLSTELTRFFACELINGLEYMRKFKVAHRDLKPENILLDAN
jgi:hypothetical protein